MGRYASGLTAFIMGDEELELHPMSVMFMGELVDCFMLTKRMPFSDSIDVLQSNCAGMMQMLRT